MAAQALIGWSLPDRGRVTDDLEAVRELLETEDRVEQTPDHPRCVLGRLGFDVIEDFFQLTRALQVRLTRY